MVPQQVVALLALLTLTVVVVGLDILAFRRLVVDLRQLRCELAPKPPRCETLIYGDGTRERINLTDLGTNPARLRQVRIRVFVRFALGAFAAPNLGRVTVARPREPRFRPVRRRRRTASRSGPDSRGPEPASGRRLAHRPVGVAA